MLVWSHLLKIETLLPVILMDLVVLVATSLLRHLLNPKRTLICLAGSNRWLQTKNVSQITITYKKIFSVKVALPSTRIWETWEGAMTNLWTSYEWLTITMKTIKTICMVQSRTMSFSKNTMRLRNNSSGYSRNCPSNKKNHHYKLRQRHTFNREPDSFLTSLLRLWAQLSTQMIPTIKVHQTNVSQWRRIRPPMTQIHQMMRT